MLRFLFTPRWLAVHVAFVLLIAFCVFAGWWQFGAYQDSQSRHDERDRAPVPMRELVQPGGEIAEAADRPVIVDGRYLTEYRLVVPGRIHEGALGWFVVVPIETGDGTVVPVVRGWVTDPESAEVAARQQVSVTGHLLPPETPDHATVRTGQVLDDTEIPYIAPDTVAAATGLPGDTIMPGFVLMSDEDPAAPAAGELFVLDVDEVAPVRNVNPWQNLSYWAQWWVFAVAGLVFWVSVVRSGIRSRRRAASPDPGGVSAPEPPRVPS